MISAPINDPDKKIFHALSSLIPGEITQFSRQTRWRPAWDVEIQQGQKIKRIHVRAEKGQKYEGPLSLHQEAGVHAILERHGVPVPHVYGMIEDPIAIVMDLIPGQINLSTANSAEARESIRSQYIQALATMHAIPVEEFKPLGLPIPQTPKDIALNLYIPSEKIYRKRMEGRPFPLMEFIWKWVKENIPQHRRRVSFISADSGQFLFDGDQLTGLIDFEVGYLGDPLAEFAGLRLRDTAEPLGDISDLISQYEQLTGDTLDKQSIEYHTAGFCAVNGFLLWPLAFDPDINDDYLAYLSFSVGTSRWAIDAIAESMGLHFGDIEPPAKNPTIFPAAAHHLSDTIPMLQCEGSFAEYDQAKAHSLSLYLERCNLFGASVIEQNLADIEQLTGTQYGNLSDAEAGLVNYVLNAGPEKNTALVEYFHHWLMRQDFLLQQCGSSSYLTGQRLQHIPEKKI